MTNKNTIVISMLVIAASLVFANSNLANAETIRTVDDGDKRALDAIERKRVEAANKILNALKEYENTIKQHSFENLSTERRVMENAQGIKNKITSIIELFEDKSAVLPEVTKTSGEPYLKKIAEGKFRPHLKDYYRVTYQVFAGDHSMNDVHVVVSSDLDSKQQSVGNMFPNTSNKATFLLKAKDPSSINARIIS